MLKVYLFIYEQDGQVKKEKLTTRSRRSIDYVKKVQEFGDKLLRVDDVTPKVTVEDLTNGVDNETANLIINSLTTN